MINKRNISMILFVSILMNTFGLQVTLALYKDPYHPTAEEQIAISKVLWDIDKLNDSSDKTQIRKLQEYLESTEVPIARLAARKFIHPGFAEYSSLLKDVKNQNKYVKTTIGLVLEIATYVNANQAGQKVKEYYDNYTSANLSIALRDDIENIYYEMGWDTNMPIFQVEHCSLLVSLNNTILSDSDSEKTDILALNIWESDQPLRVFASIELSQKYNLIGVAEKIVNFLYQDESKIYQISTEDRAEAGKVLNAIDLLKSLPNVKSLVVLHKLANSKNPEIALNASDAIKWIESGVPYPYKYYRLLWINSID
jgi:hypothetical protein